MVKLDIMLRIGKFSEKESNTLQKKSVLTLAWLVNVVFVG